MKKSTKAALASGLVFPGVGQFYLRRWLRGMLFVLPTLLASGYLINYTLDRALDVVDRISSGEVAMDPAIIEEVLNEPPPPDTALYVRLSKYMLLAAWFGGIADAYWLGRKLEAVVPPDSDTA